MTQLDIGRSLHHGIRPLSAKDTDQPLPTGAFMHAAFNEVLQHDFTGLSAGEIMKIAAKATTDNTVVNDINTAREVRATQRLKKELSRLPHEGTTGPDQARWEKAGFVFGASADDLYRDVKFPDGWSIENRERDTRHMTLVDAQGNARGGMSAKHSGHDNWAQCNIYTRLRVQDAKYIVPSFKETKGIVAVVITFRQVDVKYPDIAVIADAGIFSLKTKRPGSWQIDTAARKKVRARAEAWLNDVYPNWKDPSAYWDVEICGWKLKG